MSRSASKDPGVNSLVNDLVISIDSEGQVKDLITERFRAIADLYCLPVGDKPAVSKGRGRNTMSCVRDELWKDVSWVGPVSWKELVTEVKKAYRLELSLDPGLYGPGEQHFIRSPKRVFIKKAQSRKNDGAVYYFRGYIPNTWPPGRPSVLQVQSARPNAKVTPYRRPV